MRSFVQIAAALCLYAAGHSLASPVLDKRADPGIIVHPGGPDDIIITKENTLNATNSSPPPSSFRTAAVARLPLALVNEIRAGPVTCYISGIDPSGRAVFVQSNGQFYYPTAVRGQNSPQPITANIGIPLGAYGSTTNVNIPDYITSARVWTAVGTLKFYTLWPSSQPALSVVQPSAVNPQDPSAGVKWGFVELTNTKSGIYANLSFVDFVGLVLGISLKTTDGRTLTAKGLKPGALTPICDAMNAIGQQDGQPWGNLCMRDSSGNALRILAPQDYLSLNTPRFDAYWTNYANAVLARFSKETLYVDTPSTVAGRVACRTSGSTIVCDGDNYSYGIPTALDIFGCASGPFLVRADENPVHKSIRATLCAAYNRATLLLSGGNIQPGVPSTSYYLSEPSNQYAKVVHQQEVDGRGYAFPFDDVTAPGGPDQSGSLVDPNPSLLTVYVGGQQ